eukprot:m.38336 g.38336  ORF g.38336 m.38336 type:complete len:52 (-) comp13377_c0_seq1:133-288(-)
MAETPVADSTTKPTARKRKPNIESCTLSVFDDTAATMHLFANGQGYDICSS